jgi:hypothetical protein
MTSRESADQVGEHDRVALVAIILVELATAGDQS